MDNISISATAVHQALKTKLTNLLQEYSTNNKLNRIEILCVASQIVGMLITYQDQRIFNSDQIMDIVNKNIIEGNQVAVLQIRETKGNS